MKYEKYEDEIILKNWIVFGVVCWLLESLCVVVN